VIATSLDYVLFGRTSRHDFPVSFVSCFLAILRMISKCSFITLSFHCKAFDILFCSACRISIKSVCLVAFGLGFVLVGPTFGPIWIQLEA